MNIKSKEELRIGLPVQVTNMNLTAKERAKPMKGHIVSMSTHVFNVSNGLYQESFAYRDINKGIKVKFI